MSKKFSIIKSKVKFYYFIALLTKDYLMKKNILLSGLSLTLFASESFAMPEEEKNIPFPELRRSWRAKPHVLQPGEYDSDKSKVSGSKSKNAADLNEGSSEEDNGSFEWEAYEDEKQEENDSFSLRTLLSNNEKK